MSTRRLVATLAAMGGLALFLTAVCPGPAELTATLLHAQWVADAAGPDAVVLCGAGALAWLTWGLGALGLLLTAAGALPGAAGRVATLLSRLLVPAGARRAAALLLGMGLSLNGPLLAGAALAAPSTGPAVSTPVEAVPDWPVAAPAAEVVEAGEVGEVDEASAAPVPDWPLSAPAGAHVVVRGESLWHIAAAHLRAPGAPPPTDASITRAVHAWWQCNADVIGSDPDLLLPGQVLRPPPAP